MQVGNSKAHNQTHPTDKMLYKLKEGNPLTMAEILDGNNNFPPFAGLNRNNPVLALRTTESGASFMESKLGVLKSRILLIGIALLMLALPLPALAALGGDVTTVHQDQAQMKGSLKTTRAQAYTLHEIKAPGSTIKEYVSPAGKVFAVTWHGQFIPNMQQLLGTYFDQFEQAAKAQRESHRGHQPVSIQQPGLVFQNGGHMRSYSGRAYVPEMVPQGITMGEIQ